MPTFIAPLLCASLFVNASQLDGRHLEPKVDDRGKYMFTLRYAYDNFRTLKFAFTAELTPAERAALPATLQWAVVDVVDHRLYQTWTSIPREAFLGGTLEVKKLADILRLLPNLRRAALVFAVDRARPLYRLELAPLCAAPSMDVLDLTNPFNPACEVAPGQLPTLTKTCVAEIARLEAQVALGTKACGAANDKLQLLGCDYFTCR